MNTEELKELEEILKTQKTITSIYIKEGILKFLKERNMNLSSLIELWFIEWYNKNFAKKHD